MSSKTGFHTRALPELPDSDVDFGIEVLGLDLETLTGMALIAYE